MFNLKYHDLKISKQSDFNDDSIGCTVIQSHFNKLCLFIAKVFQRRILTINAYKGHVIYVRGFFLD